MGAELAIGSFAVAVAVVVGLVQVAKTIGLPDRFAPLVSLAFGVGTSFVTPSETVLLTVLVGIIIGLSASGLYSGTKSVVRE